MTKQLRRMVLTVAAAPVAALVLGCNSGDNTRIVAAPKYEPPADPGPPPKLKHYKGQYGASAKYQELMEKQMAKQAGR